MGACDDEHEAKFSMGALGGSIPAPSGGTYDFSNFVPGTVAQAAVNIGLDLKNKVANPGAYDVGTLATTLSSQLRNYATLQSCALSGTAGCGTLVTNLVNNGHSADLSGVTIGKPPGASCATGSCVTGSFCKAQSDGSLLCVAVSDKLGVSCSSSTDCDAATFCSYSGFCVLQAGSPTGMTYYSSGTSTGTLDAATYPSSGQSGGTCTSDSGCATGSTCSGGVCVASTVITWTGGTLSTGAVCDNNLQCVSGNCSSGTCQSSNNYVSEGGSTGTSSCTSSCPLGTHCTSDSLCASGYCGYRTSGTASGSCRVIGVGESGVYCGAASHCQSGLTCTANICQSSAPPPSGFANGMACSADSQCISTYCGGVPSARVCKYSSSGHAGEVCTFNSQCYVGLICMGGLCS